MNFYKKLLHAQTLMLLALGSLVLHSKQASARVILPPCFSDNMVLQQHTQAALWGTGTPGSSLQIRGSWSHEKYSLTIPASGRWQVKVATPRAGGPYTLLFDDGEPLILKNILIGEVWICSGQSNMEFPLAGWGMVLNSKQEIAAAGYPEIRLLQVSRATGSTETDSFKVRNNGWEQCSPASIAEFSAVAYFFARNIFLDKHIPIGLIHSSWGGTVAEAWTSAPALKRMAEFTDAVNEVIKAGSNIRKDSIPFILGNPNRPAVLFNAMIRPLIPFTIRGAIWYQGESNADRAWQYQTLFPLMIQDWRNHWGLGDFPFLFVQLANFKERLDHAAESDWAELREAQLKTLSLPNTGMAVTIDIGEGKDIHPKNKQGVGNRLALIARARVYGEKIEWSGPVFSSMRLSKEVVIMHFTHDRGLGSSDSTELKGFTVAGKDHIFHNARAEIKGSSVHISSTEVAEPIAVRYGWADNPAVSLINAAGLPASPFRTDQWTEITRK